jgi:hypothetical protein
MIVLIDEEADVVLARVESSVGALLVLAQVEFAGRILMLRGLHVEGENVEVNQLKITGIRQLVRDVMEILDVDELIIEGAIRTSGSGPGRRPRGLRFSRPVSAQEQSS